MKVIVELEISFLKDIQDTEETLESRWTNNKVTAQICDVVEKGALCHVEWVRTMKVD